MSSPQRSLKIIGRVADRVAAERARIAQIPRRGIATYYPGAGQLNSDGGMTSGGSGILASSYTDPPRQYTINGDPVNLKSVTKRDWPAQSPDNGMNVKLGQPRPLHLPADTPDGF